MLIIVKDAAINLSVALACGALIGSERQVRQRMAGLRTNALVALGASAFVVFASLFPGEASPTRVAAQVVSGIGFLGAGIIFRDGFNVHGLNTAATLWCSAAVGLMAGAGAWPLALLLTSLVVFVNLGLRPLVRWLKRHTNSGVPLGKSYRVIANCDPAAEADLRALMLRSLSGPGLKITEINRQASGSAIELAVTLHGEGVGDDVLEQAIHRLAGSPEAVTVKWHNLDEA
jgi:putative Mg2+ transporter-C (MgtC) family protein